MGIDLWSTACFAGAYTTKLPEYKEIANINFNIYCVYC